MRYELRFLEIYGLYYPVLLLVIEPSQVERASFPSVDDIQG